MKLDFLAIIERVLKARASRINEEMKLTAAYALASLILKKELNKNYINPNVFNPLVVKLELKAVTKATIESGVAKI